MCSSSNQSDFLHKNTYAKGLKTFFDITFILLKVIPESQLTYRSIKVYILDIFTVVILSDKRLPLKFIIVVIVHSVSMSVRKWEWVVTVQTFPPPTVSNLSDTDAVYAWHCWKYSGCRNKHTVRVSQLQAFPAVVFLRADFKFAVHVNSWREDDVHRIKENWYTRILVTKLLSAVYCETEAYSTMDGACGFIKL